MIYQRLWVQYYSSKRLFSIFLRFSQKFLQIILSLYLNIFTRICMTGPKTDLRCFCINRDEEMLITQIVMVNKINKLKLL